MRCREMLFFLGLLAPVPTLAQQEPAPCPGANAWNDAHPEESDAEMAARDANRSLSEPALRVELAERHNRDQEARIAWLADRGNLRLMQRVSELDADNLAWLARLVRKNGFPTAAQVGEQGIRHAWTLAQHADRDPQFQAWLLPFLLKRHAEGELSGMDLSRFVDRVLVAHGKPQRYGTQFSPEAWASSHYGLADEQSVQTVERNRRELGIMPLADYVCMMSHARAKRP